MDVSSVNGKGVAANLLKGKLAIVTGSSRGMDDPSVALDGRSC